MITRAVAMTVCLGLVTTGGVARASVFSMPAGQTSLEFVTVGDPGNAGDAVVENDGSVPRYGSVRYVYQMGKYDVTTAQYCQFLNAVAKTDPYGVYSAYMGNIPYIGCGITQSGNSGSYTYSVVAGRENLPANYISWGDAARFANWLSNGQPTGAEDTGTTETGSYTLNGAISAAALMAIARNPGATYVIPSINEWHKAAYYKGGGTNAGYWLYPTKSDAAPSNILSSTGTNNANYIAPGLWYADPVNYLTPVGEFAGSPGPYGTFDMGGNVFQWNEAIHGPWRGLLGGAFDGPLDYMQSSFDYEGYPAVAVGYLSDHGFRVALVPEPASMMVLALGGLAAIARRRAVRR